MLNPNSHLALLSGRFHLPLRERMVACRADVDAAAEATGLEPRQSDPSSEAPTSDNTMNYTFHVVVERDAHQWRAYCPAFESYEASTRGETREEALTHIHSCLFMILAQILAQCVKSLIAGVLFSHAFSGELKAVSIVNEAVEDGVAEGIRVAPS